MNIHASETKLTAAEAALIDGFTQRAAELPGDGDVMVRRDDAVEILKAGLPNRKVEAWHYTDLRRLLDTVPAYDSTVAAGKVTPLLEGASVFAVLNGHADAAPDIEGVTTKLMRDALTEGGDAAARLSPADKDDTVGALNSALVTDGFLIDIAGDTALEAPIELQNIQDGGQAHTRHVVTIGSGARATIVERQAGSGEALVSSVSHVSIGDGAEVTWIIVQEHPLTTTCLGQMNLSFGKDARVTLFVLNAGGKLVRQEIRATTAGEGSEFKLRGVNLLSDSTHCDVTMVLDHESPDTTSTEVLRNVVTDKAQGVFQGQIRVARAAQKTDAKMSCNTLLLSDEGGFSAKPELEIFADDVACGHGATVTEIEPTHLFYLMARGIDEKTARGLLVRAFVAEVIEELDDEKAVAALDAMLDRWFGEHG